MTIDNTTLARPYAKAFFEYALEQDALLQWSSFLDVAAQISSHADVIDLLKNPQVTDEQLIELYESVCSRLLDESKKNAVRLLTMNRRLALFPEMASLFEEFRAEHEKVISVEFISKTEPSEQQKQKIIDVLKKRLNSNVDLQCRSDDTFLGGAIIRAGDLVIDGSIKSKLVKLRKELIA